MRITVMSRTDAIIYCYKTHENKTVMISISDPYMEYEHSPFCTEENNIVAILPLCFADADKPGYDVYGRTAGISDLMKDEDGRKIAAFLKQYPDTEVIVHCDAGISRSAGVAAAILKYFTGDDSTIFDSARFYPNMWCYRKTLQALEKQ